MSPSDYAAWYGAVVATVVLVWDYVKWKKSGPLIKAEARAGWRTSGFDANDGEDVTFLKATNTGDRATTLTSWGLYWYLAGVELYDKSKRKAFIIKGGVGGTGVVPTKLEPGDVWSGASKETADFKQLLATGKCFMALGFSHSEDEVLVEVIANKALQPTGPASVGSGG